MSFQDLKTRKSSIDKLLQAAQADNTTPAQQNDQEFWKADVDKAGNGFAVVRFLPAPEGEDLPWAKYWSHGFKGSTGSWFIEDCLTSINADCPVCQANSELWNSGFDEDKEVARSRKRRLHYISNILVLNDQANPENNGKIFQFKYGKKIFDMLMDAMNPQFSDENPVNPFDFWEGADFKIKIRNVEGYRNYDKSEFAPPSELANGDENILEGMYRQLKPLKRFTDPANYKSYEELSTKFARVTGKTVSAPTATAEQMSSEDYSASFKSAPGEIVSEVVQDDIPFDTPAPATESADDALSYFAKLANS